MSPRGSGVQRVLEGDWITRTLNSSVDSSVDEFGAVCAVRDSAGLQEVDRWGHALQGHILSSAPPLSVLALLSAS